MSIQGRKSWSVRRILVLSVFVLLLTMMTGIMGIHNVKADDPVPEQVKTIRWLAKLRSDLKLQKNGQTILLKKGSKVVVTNRAFSADGSSGASTILADGALYRVSNKYLSYIKDLCSVLTEGDYSAETKTAFVNRRGFPSKTEYLIWISLDKQRVNVFTGPKTGGNWSLIQVFPCSTGKAETPTTPHWDAEISFKAKKYRYFKTGGTLKYFSEVSGYGLHKWVGGKKRKLLGKHTASNGCIRLHEKDAKFIYNVIPVKTRVVLW